MSMSSNVGAGLSKIHMDLAAMESIPSNMPQSVIRATILDEVSGGCPATSIQDMAGIMSSLARLKVLDPNVWGAICIKISNHDLNPVLSSLVSTLEMLLKQSDRSESEVCQIIALLENIDNRLESLHAVSIAKCLRYPSSPVVRSRLISLVNFLLTDKALLRTFNLGTNRDLMDLYATQVYGAPPKPFLDNVVFTAMRHLKKRGYYQSTLIREISDLTKHMASIGVLNQYPDFAKQYWVAVNRWLSFGSHLDQFQDIVQDILVTTVELYRMFGKVVIDEESAQGLVSNVSKHIKPSTAIALLDLPFPNLNKQLKYLLETQIEAIDPINSTQEVCEIAKLLCRSESIHVYHSELTALLVKLDNKLSLCNPDFVLESMTLNQVCWYLQALSRSKIEGSNLSQPFHMYLMRNLVSITPDNILSLSKAMRVLQWPRQESLILQLATHAETSCSDMNKSQILSLMELLASKSNRHEAFLFKACERLSKSLASELDWTNIATMMRTLGRFGIAHYQTLDLVQSKLNSMKDWVVDVSLSDLIDILWAFTMHRGLSDKMLDNFKKVLRESNFSVLAPSSRHKLYQIFAANRKFGDMLEDPEIEPILMECFAALAMKDLEADAGATNDVFREAKRSIEGGLVTKNYEDTVETRGYNIDVVVRLDDFKIALCIIPPNKYARRRKMLLGSTFHKQKTLESLGWIFADVPLSIWKIRDNKTEALQEILKRVGERSTGADDIQEFAFQCFVDHFSNIVTSRSKEANKLMI